MPSELSAIINIIQPEMAVFLRCVHILPFWDVWELKTRMFGGFFVLVVFLCFCGGLFVFLFVCFYFC